MQASRITIFAGHYGSGKTNLAVNYASLLKQTKQRVVICDLDIVNPYFRTTDAAERLSEKGIGIIASQYANSNVDLPAVPPGMQAVFDDREVCAVIDLGGDDRGALALGRYSGQINSENDYEMLLVVNQYRPMTRSAADLAAIRSEIESAAKVRFTGLVNNSNLGAETTLEDVLGTLRFAQELADELKLPVKMTAINRELINKQGVEELKKLPDIFPVEIYKKTIWRI